jgi:4-oxalocrotonate tautomerase
MPVVTIQVTREGTRPSASSVTDATYVIIEEVEPNNWGWGGLPALEYRRRKGNSEMKRFGRRIILNEEACDEPTQESDVHRQGPYHRWAVRRVAER